MCKGVWLQRKSTKRRFTKFGEICLNKTPLLFTKFGEICLNKTPQLGKRHLVVHKEESGQLADGK